MGHLGANKLVIAGLKLQFKGCLKSVQFLRLALTDYPFWVIKSDNL